MPAVIHGEQAAVSEHSDSKVSPLVTGMLTPFGRSAGNWPRAASGPFQLRLVCISGKEEGMGGGFALLHVASEHTQQYLNATALLASTNCRHKRLECDWNHIQCHRWDHDRGHNVEVIMHDISIRESVCLHYAYLHALTLTCAHAPNSLGATIFWIPLRLGIPIELVKARPRNRLESEKCPFKDKGNPFQKARKGFKSAFK